MSTTKFPESSDFVFDSGTSKQTNSTFDRNISSADSFPNFYQEPVAVTAVILAIEGMVCCFGVVGNILICMVIVRSRNMRSRFSYYIFNLALSDLGVLLICFPFTIVKEQNPYGWPLGSFICRWIYPLSDIFYGGSIATIIMIAFDRYRAIVHGIRPKAASKTIVLNIAGMWLVAMIFIVLPLFLVMEYKENKQTKDCTPNWSHDMISFKIYHMSLVILWYVLPLCAILVCYRKIGKQIQESRLLHSSIRKESCPYLSPGPARRHISVRRATASGLSDDGVAPCSSPTLNKRKEIFSKRGVLTEKQIDYNNKALRLLTPVVLVFTIAMLPFNIFRVCFVFTDIRSFPFAWLVYKLCTVFLLANSSANPVIYSLISSEFRKGFQQLLFFKFPISMSSRRSRDSTRTRSVRSRSHRAGPIF